VYARLPGPTAGLPKALRVALALKFADFDEYGLAKYNKDKAVGRKNAKAKGRASLKSHHQETCHSPYHQGAIEQPLSSPGTS